MFVFDTTVAASEYFTGSTIHLVHIFNVFQQVSCEFRQLVRMILM